MKEKILLIEHDTNNISKIENILGDYYEITNVSEGENAKKLFSIEQDSIKVILLNLETIDIFGINLIGQLKEINYSTEIITYIAHDNIQACVDAMEAGAYDYFHLPFDPEGLVISVEKAIDSFNLVKEVEDKSGNQLLQEHPAKNRLDVIQEYTAKKAIEGNPVSPHEFFSLLYTENSKEKIYPGFSQHVADLMELQKSDKQPVVLAIDDNENALAGYEILLRDEYDTHFANCAQAGLEKAKELKEIDIIFLDIMMPDRNGDEIMPELKEIHPEAAEAKLRTKQL